MQYSRPRRVAVRIGSCESGDNGSISCPASIRPLIGLARSQHSLTDIRQIPAVSAEDRAFARLDQRQFAVTASKGPSKRVVDGGPTLKRAALLVPRQTSPLIARCTWLALVMPARAAPADGRSATGCRRTSVAAQRPSAIWKGHVATVAHHLRADLDQLFTQASQ